MRRVLSLLSDGTDLPEVSLNDFSWRTSRTFDEKGSHISHDQLTRIVRINSFDLFGSSALFGAILGEIEKVPEHSKFIKVMSCLNSPSYDFFLPAIDFVTLIRFEIGSFCEGRRLLLPQTLEFVPTERCLSDVQAGHLWQIIRAVQVLRPWRSVIRSLSEQIVICSRERSFRFRILTC